MPLQWGKTFYQVAFLFKIILSLMKVLCYLEYMKLQQGLPFYSVILELKTKDYLKTQLDQGTVGKLSGVCLGVRQGSVGDLLGVHRGSVRCLLSGGAVRSLIVTKILRADLDSSTNWDLMSSPTNFFCFGVWCMSVRKKTMESIGHQVHWVSVRTLLGVW
jgi:hypothetical protein